MQVRRLVESSLRQCREDEEVPGRGTGRRGVGVGKVRRKAKGGTGVGGSKGNIYYTVPAV